MKLTANKPRNKLMNWCKEVKLKMVFSLMEM